MEIINLSLRTAAFVCLFSFGTVSAQDYKAVIKNHLASQTSLLKSDTKDFEVISEDFSKTMNAYVVKIQRTYSGIPIYDAFGTALVRNDKIAHLSADFTEKYFAPAASGKPVSSQNVFRRILQQEDIGDVAQYTLLASPEAQRSELNAVSSRLVYYSSPVGELRLCYQYSFEEAGTSNYWNIIADASTAEIISKINLTLSCNFLHTAFNHEHHDASEVLPKNKDQLTSDLANFALAPDNASYRVFTLPTESPSHGARSLVSNPWFIDASPDGWHRIAFGTYRGAYTITRGNNVYAYEDISNTNKPGVSPDGGPTRTFDFPFIENATNDNLDAATTNLFFVNNKVHDIFYRFGFTETTRNFQAYNFNKGGLQNDYVLAESQDGRSRNNANFSTPPDGYSPRMQMYLWDAAIIERVFYNAPAEAIGHVVWNVISSTFGPPFTVSGVTGDVKIAVITDGCSAMPAGSLSGKIGLMQRGGCDFTKKVKNAQNAGAIAAIIYNLPDSSPTAGMAGDDTTITIPSVLIDNSEGVYMTNLLNAGKNVNITLKFDPNSQKIRDGSFDNGIIIHEYGHGISNRLTGDGYSCLSPYDSEDPTRQSGSREQMGEGWSDFFALMLTNRPGDNAQVARGIGTYASSQPFGGLGIRPARYSTDFNVNNFTYGKTNGMQYTNEKQQIVPDVHSIGFVWASMLWDLHWKYASKYGYASDVAANPASGSARVLQLVVDGLKLQVCNPTFVDGRNAILQAELATTGGADRCMIWEAFAGRGLGLNASAGSKYSINDQVQDFTKPQDCMMTADEAESSAITTLYPNPAKNEFFLKSGKNVMGKINITIYDASGKLVSSQKIAASEAVNTQSLPNGIYVVKVDGLGIQYSSKLMIKK